MADQIVCETPVNYSQRSTPADLIKLGATIWRRVVDSKISPQDEAANDKLLENLQAEFRDFSTSFPLVLRWMVQMRRFSSKSFERFLLKHASVDLKSRESFLRLQAEYLVLLYQEDNPHVSTKKVEKYRESVVKHLIDEDKAFVEIQKQVDEDFKKSTMEINDERKRRLYEYLVSQRVAAEAQRETVN